MENEEIIMLISEKLEEEDYNCQTFEEAGLLTNDEGVVANKDDNTFHITIQKF